MKTKMQVLAEILGVEFEEEFTLEWDKINYKCRITETDGLLWHSKTGWHKASGALYRDILFDDVKVFKLYYPSEGEQYFIPRLCNYSSYSERNWNESEFDIWAYEHGLVCKTREEAQELTDKLAVYAKSLKENK